MKFPDLEELVTLRGTARAWGLRSLRPAHAPLLGAHRGAHGGRGLEFEEVRAYVPGDDSRSIDWRVTARRGRLHTKLFREERERPVWLLVDLQPGMFFASRRQMKSFVAVRAAALLAWVAVTAGERIGAVIANGAETICLPPRSREAGALPILNALLALQPRRPAPPVPGNLVEALRLLAPMVHPGSLTLALSDFAEFGQTGEAPWASLAAHGECQWFWITDALEQHGLPDGRYRGGAPGRLLPIDGAGSRTRWLAAWAARAARIESLAARFAMTVTRLDTGTAVESSLQLALRQHRFAA